MTGTHIDRYVTVTVKVLGDRNIVVSGTNEHGDPASQEGTVADDRRWDEVIRILRDMVRNDRLRSREEFELLGSAMFDKLFHGETRTFLGKQVDRINDGKILRLVLQFGEGVHLLGELPWEFLYLPADLSAHRSGFVASKEELVLSRRVEAQSNLTPGESPIRILFGVASPHEYEGPSGRVGMPSAIDVTDLVATLSRLHDGGSFDVRRDMTLTQSGLADALKDFKPHVVHIVAHGRYDKDGSAIALCSKDEPGLANWLVDQTLADMLQGSSAAVVFLQACSSAYSDAFESFRGMALRLVSRGIPAVIAMSFDIKILTASEFARRFYESLAEGLPVDHAVQNGRRHVGMPDESANFFDGRAFGCPVAFVQVGRGLVLGSPSREPERDRPGQTEPPHPGGESLVRECPICLKPVKINYRGCPHCRTEIQPCSNPSCGQMMTTKPTPYCPSCLWSGTSAPVSTGARTQATAVSAVEESPDRRSRRP